MPIKARTNDPERDRDVPQTTDVAELEYPRTLYHTSSTPGNLIGRAFQTAEEVAAAGGGWGPASDLPFETAPSSRATAPAVPPQPAPTGPSYDQPARAGDARGL